MRLKQVRNEDVEELFFEQVKNQKVKEQLKILLNQLKATQKHLELNYDLRADRGIGEKMEDFIIALEGETK